MDIKDMSIGLRPQNNIIFRYCLIGIATIMQIVPMTLVSKALRRNTNIKQKYFHSKYE